MRLVICCQQVANIISIKNFRQNNSLTNKRCEENIKRQSLSTVLRHKFQRLRVIIGPNTRAIAYHYGLHTISPSPPCASAYILMRIRLYIHGHLSIYSGQCYCPHLIPPPHPSIYLWASVHIFRAMPLPASHPVRLHPYIFETLRKSNPPRTTSPKQVHINNLHSHRTNPSSFYAP